MLLDPFRVQFKCSCWVKASWNFPFYQNDPSLLLCFQNHWLDFSMIIEVWSHDLVLMTVFPTIDCSLEDRDISFIFLFWNDTQWLLWQTLTSVKLSWIPAICTVPSVTLARLLNIWGLSFLRCKLGAVKKTAGKNSSTTMFHSFNLDNIKIDINTEVYTVTSSFFQVRKLSREDLGNFV